MIGTDFVARSRAQAAAHLGARDVGQHQVEQHEVGPLATDLGERARSIARVAAV